MYFTIKSSFLAIYLVKYDKLKYIVNIFTHMCLLYIYGLTFYQHFTDFFFFYFLKKKCAN